MNAFLKITALAAATASLAAAIPASAATSYDAQFSAPGEQSYNHGRERYSREDWRRGYRYSYDDGRDYRGSYRGYDRPVYRDSRAWRGDDGRYYCRKDNGTTGLIVGGAAGALLGREIDGGRDRTLGTVLGAVGGALLGREVDRGDSRCR
ncbi:Glycine zipper 2TM domain-containing protein [Novosphingobium sp. CF614]|uniref:glycine zipper 2TM domain-containing protein n=1 Tax=Novosphingobium sp. CF614 TaxID=1884364 RepID=UPI0008F24192|nr:glycine zipper 2TM domain-containing protein [Novosphingobium sp. CF614]SFF75017.1 Glycine zipper 2TM domain-containing protein [Novosphingobium sp. CF614]